MTYLEYDTMDMFGSLIPPFVFERIHHIVLSGINSMPLNSWSSNKYIYNLLQI